MAGPSLIENKIPPEILSLIFEIGFEPEVNSEDDESLLLTDEDSNDVISNESDDSSDEGDGPKKPLFAVNLSHVCRRWRHVALATPSIWTKIKFSQDSSLEQNVALLERSKSCLLELELIYPLSELPDELIHSESEEATQILDDTRKSLRLALDLIIPHAPRWVALEVTVGVDELMELLLSRLEEVHDASQLRKLSLFSLDFLDENEAQDPRTFRLLGGNVRSLVTLELGRANIALGCLTSWSTNVKVTGISPPPSMSTTKLTTLYLSYISFDLTDLVSLFTCSPSIEKFSTENVDLLLPHHTPSSVLLPKLKKIAISTASPTDAVLLSASFFSPVLESLELTFEDENLDYSNAYEELARPPQALIIPTGFEDNIGEGNIGKIGLKMPSMLTTVKKIEVVFGGHLSLDTALYFLEACSNLTDLYLTTDMDIHSLFTVLRDNAIGQAAHTDSYPSSIMGQLHPNSITHPLLCPHLKAFTIFGGAPFLTEFVRCRDELGHRIQSLDVDVGQPMPAQMVDELSQHVDELICSDDELDSDDSDDDSAWTTTDTDEEE